MDDIFTLIVDKEKRKSGEKKSGMYPEMQKIYRERQLQRH